MAAGPPPTCTFTVRFLRLCKLMRLMVPEMMSSPPLCLRLPETRSCRWTAVKSLAYALLCTSVITGTCVREEAGATTMPGGRASGSLRPASRAWMKWTAAANSAASSMLSCGVSTRFLEDKAASRHRIIASCRHRIDVTGCVIVSSCHRVIASPSASSGTGGGKSSADFPIYQLLCFFSYN